MNKHYGTFTLTVEAGTEDERNEMTDKVCEELMTRLSPEVYMTIMGFG